MIGTHVKNSVTFQFIKFFEQKKSIKHQEITNCHQNLVIFGNRLFAANFIFFKKNVTQIEIPVEIRELTGTYAYSS